MTVSGYPCTFTGGGFAQRGQCSLFLPFFLLEGFPKVELVFDHGGELYKSEKYQHVEESRMKAICKTLISFTMALNLSSIYSDQRVKRVLLHLVPSPPLPLLPCFTGSTIFTSSHCKQAMLGFVSTSLALSCYSTRPDAPLFHLSLPEK